MTANRPDGPISLFRPVIDPEAIAAVAEVLESGWVMQGPRVKAFEEAFAEYLGSNRCVALNSGTSSLHLAIRLLDLGPGDEVITTPLTFVSTNHVILYAGARPVFADVQPRTGNLDPNSIAERIGPSTRAIVLVHYGGYPCDLDEIYGLAKKHGVAVIEDCAHACGASYRSQKIGTHGDLHAFSFQATKNLPVGDGAMLVVRSTEHELRLRRLRVLGMDRDAFERSEDSVESWQYDVTELGFRYAMSDISAAIALVHLRRLDADNHRRAAIARAYTERLADLDDVELLERKHDRVSSNHLFGILVEGRDQLLKNLEAAGVEAGIHYRRNDLYPMYDTSELPNADRFAQREISLPMHLALEDDHIDYICEVIHAGW